jgi:hypothetical protein
MRLQTIVAEAVLIKQAEKDFEVTDFSREFVFAYDDIKDLLKVLSHLFPTSAYSDDLTKGQDFWIGNFTFFLHYQESEGLDEEEFLRQKVQHLTASLDPEAYEFWLIRNAD